MPAGSTTDTIREVSSQIVIAVAWLTHAIGATNDNVGGERVAGAVVAIRVSRAGEATTGRVVCDLGIGDCSSSEDKSRVHHVGCVFKMGGFPKWARGYSRGGG